MSTVLSRFQADLIVLLFALAGRVTRFLTSMEAASKESDRERDSQLKPVEFDGNEKESDSLPANGTTTDFALIDRTSNVRYHFLSASTWL